MERKFALGGCGTYGSSPEPLPAAAACMPFNAPFAEGEFGAPFAVAGDPCACVCVVCAGGFCEENLELILDIHELRRELPFGSGGVVPLLGSLPRLSIAGRLGAIFWGAEVAEDAGTGAGGEADRWTGGAIPWVEVVVG